MHKSTETAQEISIRALTFLVSDDARLSRFLALTGWTPETLANPGSRDAILIAALDHLMREEDLLLTFTANEGLDPVEISKAFRLLSGEPHGERGT